MAGASRQYVVRPRGEIIVGVVEAGQFTAHSRGASTSFGPGDLCLWDGDAPHWGEAIDGRPWVSRLLVFEPGPVADLWESLSSALRTRAHDGPVLRDRDLARTLYALHHRSEPTKVLEPEQLYASTELLMWVEAFAARVAGRAPAPIDWERARRERRVKHVVDYLHEHLDANVSISELATLVEWSPFHLVRTFTAVTGLPPHRYQLALRIAHARRLLESGASIVDAAAHSGFSDQSHLHRHFAPRLGLTPAQYAAAVRPA